MQLQIHIKTGSWTRPKIPFEERKCNECNLLENEYHLVLECKKYDNLRKQYISKYFYQQPSMYKFIKLMNCTKKKVLNNLAKFVFKAFAKM